jgi:hypothetical protein
MPMTDDHVFTDDVGDPGVTVDDSIVLHVGAPADDHWGNVAANDGIEPEAYVLGDGYIPDDGAVMGSKRTVGMAGE